MTRYVSPGILWERFNRSQIPEMMERGKLTVEYLPDAHLTNPERVAENRCTRGQMVRYRNAEGTWLVEVFQYLPSDGSLGASGRPDPKRMRVGAEVWIADQ